MFAYWPAADTPLAVQVRCSRGASEVRGHVTATPRSSVTATLESVSLPVLVTRYVHRTGSPTGTAGPGGASASLPLVSFWMSIAGAGGTRLTIVQVAIDSCVTVVLKPFGVVVTRSGRSEGESGLRTTHDVAEGSLTKPGRTPAGFSSVIDTR